MFRYNKVFEKSGLSFFKRSNSNITGWKLKDESKHNNKLRIEDNEERELLMKKLIFEKEELYLFRSHIKDHIKDYLRGGGKDSNKVHYVIADRIIDDINDILKKRSNDFEKKVPKELVFVKVEPDSDRPV
jgi:hypothetical protein